MSTYRVVEAVTTDQMKRFYTLQNLIDFAHELTLCGVDARDVTIRCEGKVKHRLLEHEYPIPIDQPF